MAFRQKCRTYCPIKTPDNRVRLTVGRPDSDNRFTQQPWIEDRVSQMSKFLLSITKTELFPRGKIINYIYYDKIADIKSDIFVCMLWMTLISASD